MAKHCAVCKRSYPDDQLSCPHCAAKAAEGSEVSLGGSSAPAPAGPPSDSSAVDLGATPRRSTGDTNVGSGEPLDLSGVSAIEWAALVEETAPASSPSAAPEETPETEEPFRIEDVIESAEITAVGGDIQVPGEPVSVVENLADEPPKPSAGGESAVDLGATVAAEAESSSSVNLGEPGHLGQGGSILAGPVSDSGIDLVEAEDATPGPFGAEVDIPVGATDASAVNLGADPEGEDAEVLDLAELGFAAEELVEASAGSAAKKGSGIDLVAEEQVMADQGEPASSVQLGMGVPPGPEASEVRLADVPVPAAHPTDSGIDLVEVSMDEGSGIRPIVPEPAKESPPTPRAAVPTTLAPRGAQPTTLAPRPQTTSLAPPDVFPNMELAALDSSSSDRGKVDEIVQETAGEEVPADLIEETMIGPESVESNADAVLVEDIAADMPPEDGAAELVEEELVSEDLPLEKPAAEEKAPSWMEEEEEVLLGADMHIPSGEGSSARDLIAEAVESGVDINRAHPAAKERTEDINLEEISLASSGASGEEVDLETIGMAPSMPSSAVDLGNPETGRPPANSPGSSPSGMDSGIDVEVINPRPSRLEMGPVSTGDEEVDLGAPPRQPVSSRAPASESGIDVEILNPRPSIEETEDYRKTVGATAEMTEAEDDFEEDTPKGKKDKKKASKKKAVGADEEEDDEDEETPRKGKKGKVVVRSGGSRIGWATLGLLLGAGAVIATSIFVVDVPHEAKKLIGMADTDNGKQGSKPGSTTDKGKGPVNPVPSVDKWEHLRRGDLDQAEKAGIEQIKESDGKELVGRGQYRWEKYAQKQARSGKKLEANDKAVQDALTDLNKGIAELSKNPATASSEALLNALTTKASIDIETGNLKGAKEAYLEGKQKFKGKREERIFDTALQVLEEMETQIAPGAGAPAARAMPVNPLVIALLIGLQAPPGQNPPAGGQNPPAGGQNPPAGGQNPPAGQNAPDVDPDEAGFYFWDALKRARDHDYETAQSQLKKALDNHKKRRLIRPRQPQNPLSDPREEIFVRCAGQLEKLWKMESELSAAKGPIAKMKPVDAVKQLVQDAGAEARMRKDVADKLAEAKINAMIEKPADVAKAVEDLLEKKAQNEKDIDKLKKQVDADKMELDGLTAKLKKAEDTVKANTMELAAAAKREMDLKKARDKAEATIKKASDALVKAGYLDPDADASEFLPKLQKAAEIAQMKDPMGEIRKLQARVARDEATLTQRWKPEEMLSIWAPLLQRDRERKDLADKALLDVARVETDGAATSAQKGQANVVRGMALRNENRFADAQKALQQAKADLAKNDTAWSALATEVQKEVTDPVGYFLSWADTLKAGGNTRQALDVLNRGVLALPRGTTGMLLARRSELELAQALDRADGRLDAKDPLVQAAQKDAVAAAADGLAEGAYAAGRVAEELGQLDEAIKQYRAALAAHKEDDATGSRYKIALARALTTPRAAPVRPGRPPANPDDFKVGRAPSSPRAQVVKSSKKTGTNALALLLLMTVAFQAPDLPPPMTPEQKEADKLAEEVLKSKDATAAARAQAWAIKGLYTRALRTYAEGMIRAGGDSARQGRELLRLIDQHPLLMQPQTLTTPSPAKAEQFYANGLNFYFDRRYAEAEKAFTDAIENDNQDARYFYYLGLARMMQGKPGYNESFAQGARLEHQNRPDPASVSISLERVQGPARRTLNKARTEP